MASNVKISTLPAVKMILHAVRHPETAVNGLLLCGEEDAIKMIITDYIPLFHSPLSLAPMLEIALYQIEAYCSAAKLRICGYFQANEHLYDKEPTAFACKIAEKINEKSGPACLVILRNDRLYPASSEHFIVYTISQGKWQETKHAVSSELTVCLNHSIKSNLDKVINDFDDHLNDARCDYLNTALTSHISVCD
ncbi:ER membrane protein complex subunit 9 [Paragonimus heterotremus]|uniref:ER membrane protein complex subunit 9 n=1 Tax=Paragonimus heterotremus TaxID=100268 RepID=A0A8J4TAY9_9TREM|nr:ER membrane protein complex subunit 9 [Paragonimus heterotremus]